MLLQDPEEMPPDIAVAFHDESEEEEGEDGEKSPHLVTKSAGENKSLPKLLENAIFFRFYHTKIIFKKSRGQKPNIQYRGLNFIKKSLALPKNRRNRRKPVFF